MVQGWKSFTAHAANILIGRTGRFWQPEYFDRAIRDERHLGNALQYIDENPVKAGLVSEAGAWPFSSMARQAREGGRGPTGRTPARKGVG